MISYCPINFDNSPRQVPIQGVERPGPRSRPSPQPPREDTECNYLIMFFVVGVLMLAVSDQIKK